jgi:serine/threonine protein kinase
LISDDGRVCLSDFGLATKMDPSGENSTDDVVGTPFWRKIFFVRLGFDNKNSFY